MNFKESVNVYLEACKCDPAGGKCSNGRAASVCVAGGKCSNGKEATVYSPGTQMRSIKPFEAVKRLIELGIPKEKAIEAVSSAIADRSKIQSITNRICCECADEIDAVLDEEDDFSDENARLEKAKEHYKTMKNAAYNNYANEKRRDVESEREAERLSKMQAEKERLNRKAEKYEKKASRYINGNKAIKSDKIRKAIYGILAAAAIGGAGYGVSKEAISSYKNGQEFYDNNRNIEKQEKTVSNIKDSDSYNLIRHCYNKYKEAKENYIEARNELASYTVDYRNKDSFEHYKNLSNEVESTKAKYFRWKEELETRLHYAKKDIDDINGKRLNDYIKANKDLEDKEHNSFGYKIPGIKELKAHSYNAGMIKRGMSDIKEEIISNTCVACSENITEEAVITESIKNGSVSKGLKKQLAKLEKAHPETPGAKSALKNAINIYKNAVSDFEKVENDYVLSGDKSAKKEYKELKKKYAPQVRKIDTMAMVKGGIITAAVAASIAAATIIFNKYDPKDAEEIKRKFETSDAGVTVSNAIKGIKRKWQDITDPVNGVEKLKRSIDRNGEDLQDSAELYIKKNDIDKKFDKVGKGIKDAGEAIGSGAKSAGEAISSGAKSAGKAISSGAKSAGEAISSGAKSLKDKGNETVEKIKKWSGDRIKDIEDAREKKEAIANRERATYNKVKNLRDSGFYDIKEDILNLDHVLNG